MAGAAAGDDGDLTGLLVGGAVAAQVIPCVLDLVAMGGVDALEHLVHIAFRRIDDLLHRIASLLMLLQAQSLF